MAVRPKGNGNCSSLKGAAKEAEIDKILKNARIDENRVRNMRFEEVCLGYSAYIDDTATMDYRKAVAKRVWHGIRKESFVGISCDRDSLIKEFKYAGMMRLTA